MCIIFKTFFEKKAFARTGEAFEQQTKEHIFFQLSLILHFNFRDATCLGASNSYCGFIWNRTHQLCFLFNTCHNSGQVQFPLSQKE